MTERWFLVAAIDCVGAVVDLDPEESRHATGSRRLRDGDAVTVFDGRGTIGAGRLTARGRQVAVESIERVPAPTRHLELAAAVPKGDRVATMLDMATQLGMTAFIPLAARHSVAEAGEKPLRRWHRVCVEACKQSRRAWLPSISASPRTPEDAVREGREAGLVVLLADRDGGLIEPATGDVRILVGPEGGFDPAELEAMREAGAVPVRLGDHVLRIETAAVAACAMLSR